MNGLAAPSATCCLPRWASRSAPRPRPGMPAAPPKWMTSIDRTTPVVALGPGAALSGVNPKNLALSVTAAVAIASNGLSGGQQVASVVVFVLIGSLLG
ncbi:GAP family protein [Mumia zhuanghuii]|nr:GAP family protein [Mumia zhuanghuii]